MLSAGTGSEGQGGDVQVAGGNGCGGGNVEVICGAGLQGGDVRRYGLFRAKDEFALKAAVDSLRGVLEEAAKAVTQEAAEEE